MAVVERPADELVALVGGLSSVRMDDYAVVGSYMRFGEGVREQLKDARVRIAEACAQPAKRRDNHLLWAAPGSGKTYFVEQVAASLPAVAYVELNLAKLPEAGFREGLAQATAGGPTICLIDEVDAKPDEPWPYEALMPFLDVNLERGGGIVFVLAGSSGATIAEFKERIRARPKGTDVLSRVPEANGWEIAPMDAGDRILVALSQMRNAAAELERSIAEVEKLALHYLAAAPHLANARQLREFAVRAVERGSARSDRIRYDDLFDSGDPENKRYWVSVMPHAEALENSFVHLREVAARTPGSAADERNAPDEPRTRRELPTGTVTFLFTDVEGSTSLLHELGAEPYAAALAAHRRVIREACAANGGVEVDTQGDAFFFAFPTASGALAAASDLTDRLAASGRIRVRVGVHTGAPHLGEEGYVGHDVHRAARIAAAGHGGQVLVSAATAQLVEAELTDLGEHRFKDLGSPERVYQLGGGAFPPLKSLYRVNLPIRATPFFGRESELAELLALLTRDEVRLVTLTGPGGTGKTRLALEAAAELAESFADGVFFVALAPLRELSAVKPAVAEVVGLAADADLTAWLASRRALLVLDNLEHLRGVEAVVAELLVGDTVVLATSRGPLRLSAEREVPVEPLAREAAVELFVARAAAAGRQVAADRTVGEICRRLDDLPLAIELAAARVRLLSPTALLQRLDASLSLLTGGARDLPERHQTLRATIEWSHDLLTPGEQAAFRRLSVFRGSFTLEAAEAIAGADLDEVASLVEQSLLKPQGDDRFFLLETLREYARERLDAAGEREEYALRHAHWYLERLEQNRVDVYGPRHIERMAWFSPEEDDLRAMLIVLTSASPEQAARAARLLHGYWKSRGSYGEARERLLALLAWDDMPDQSRAVLFSYLCDIEVFVGDLDASELAARESLRLAEPGDEVSAWALLYLAQIAAARDEREEAVRFGREALEEIDAIEERDQAGFRLDVAGVFMDAGLSEEARATFLQVRDTGRRLGDLRLIAIAQGSAHELDLLEGRYEAAEEGFRTVLKTMRTLGIERFKAYSLSLLGLALLGLDSRSEARAAFASSLEIVAADSTPNIELTACLQWIALAVEPGQMRSAARLVGAADGVRRNARLTGERRTYRELRRRFEQPMIDALGEDEWARERAEGATLTLEEAIELARMLAAGPPETASHPA
ncbi:MAG: adenylate/guanylate cyclase domain-containing protein [Candidatus Limnocylindria bacterium]